MSGARRLPAITAILAVGVSVLAASSSRPIRERVSGTLGSVISRTTWKALVYVFLLLNLKNLPMVWHYRLFRALIYHLYLQPKELPKEALFLPVITRSYTSMLETDYNFHKSNSTYFTDLDIARTHLVTAIMRKGIRGIGTHPENSNASWSIANTSRSTGTQSIPPSIMTDNKTDEQRAAELLKPAPSISGLHINPLGTSAVDSGLSTPAGARTPDPGSKPPAAMTSESKLASNSISKSAGPSPFGGLSEEQWWREATKPGNLLIALGGNSCHYHREIPSYKRYEIWTRVLSWDRKWIYVVSHFVEAGAFKPRRYVLQPWKGKPSIAVNEDSPRADRMTEEERTKMRRKIYASSISKYVVKKGRLTIPPELVLQRSEMLPSRPPGAPSTFFTTTSELPEAQVGSSASTGMGASDLLEESLFPSDATGAEEEWTWERVEKERQKGLKLSQLFDGLDGLRDAFDMGEDGAMGRFTDLARGF